MPNFKTLPLLALLLTLPECAQTQLQTKSSPIQPPPSTISPESNSVTSNALICSEMQVVALSHADTTGTKEQVAANNLVLQKLCGKG